MEMLVSNATSRLLLGLALSIFFTGTTWADIFTGPVSKYYLDGGSTIYVVQGTTVVESFPTAYGGGEWEGVLAVSQTIRTRASDVRSGADLAAGEYTLSGTPTGYEYHTPVQAPFPGPQGTVVYDGTSDGLHNYFADHNPFGGGGDLFGGGVYRTDYYWQDPQFLFYPTFLCPFVLSGCQGASGIAYDPTNNSLWISSKPSPWIADYSLDGVLLAAFETPFLPDYNAALGLDPVDHTLWVTTSETSLLRQYSLDGATFGEILQEGTPDGLPLGFFSSGEFQEPVPEPSTGLLMICSLLFVIWRTASRV